MLLFGDEVQEAEAVVQVWSHGNRWLDFSTVKDEHDVLAAENIVKDSQYRIVKISDSRRAYDIYYGGKWNRERNIGASTQALEDDFSELSTLPVLDASPPQKFADIGQRWTPDRPRATAYPESIMQTLRKRRGLEPNDTSKDASINDLSPDDAFRNVLEWEGIIGFDYSIRNWVKEIYGVKIGN